MAKNDKKVVQTTIYPLLRLATFVQWPISRLHLNLSPSHHLSIIFSLL
jgi:hypothetical protein